MRKLLTICCTAAVLLLGSTEGYAFDAEDLENLQSTGSCPNCDLQEANLRGADLQDANLRGADLQDANLRYAKLQRADLQDADLRNAHLREANLQDANLQDANLQRADLRKADLGGAELRGADLRKANLQGADLWGADLRRANLQGTDLKGANLRRANLQGADLKGASLYNAKLGKANLHLANLEGATLEGANLYGANLRGAKLDSDDLAMAKGQGAVGLDASGSDVAKAVSEKPKPAKRKDNQSFNNKQLQRLFSGSTLHLQAGGLPCQESSNLTMGIGEWDFTLNKDGSIKVIFTCNSSYPEEFRSSGKWRVEGNKFCLEDQNGIISEFSVKTNDKCWLLRPGTSRFEAYDSNLTKVWEFLVFSPNLSRHYHKQITELKKLGDELLGAVSPTGTQVGVAKTPPPTKPSLPTAKSKDTTPPTITIASAITVKTDSPTIKGRATDNTQVAQVTVEGVGTDLKSDGSFTFSRYVPLGGTQVTIEAVDEWGNKAQKVVRLSRKAVQTAALSFASLDPTKIRVRPNENAIALIIGVANYSRAPAATYADNDANVFGDYAHRALGIPRSNINVMVNNKASLADTKVAVKRWLRGRIEEGKTDVHVFFAGHGLASPDGKDLYLLPYDGEPSLLDETALLRRELFEVIGKAKPKSATIFLDTCYSGLSRGKETLLASARGIVVTPKPQSIPSGFTVLSAASGQQISSGLDEAKHGLFSYYLMKGMEGGADANKDRKITASELHAYLGSRVKRQAIRLGREQTPELSGDGERVLVRW